MEGAGEQAVGDGGEAFGGQEARLVRREDVVKEFLWVELRVALPQHLPLTLNLAEPARVNIHGEYFYGEKRTQS